jgi:hypothetical protein
MATSSLTPASPIVLTTQGSWMPRIESMSQYDSSVEPAKWEVVCSYGDFPTATAYNPQSLGTPQDLGGVIGTNTKSVCVAAGLRYTAGATDLGNKQYTAGIYPWSTQKLYAREISAASGTIVNPNYYQVNQNLLGGWPSPPDYEEADASKSFALSNCSNSGEYLLSAWYDGQDVGGGAGGAIWMKLSPNTTPMVFKPTSVNNVNSVHELSLYPNPARDKVYLPQKGVYTLYNIEGEKVLTTTVAADNTIDVSSLAKGVYIIRAINKNLVYRFTKQ